MLTPFDRLDGYERRVQNASAAPAEQARPSSSQLALGIAPLIQAVMTTKADLPVAYHSGFSAYNTFHTWI